MPKAKTVKHVHRYIKVNGKHIKLWKCGIPDCKFFIHMNLEDILIGRASLCWQCGAQFALDEDSLTEDMPRCVNCKLADQMGVAKFDPMTILEYVAHKTVERRESVDSSHSSQSVDSLVNKEDTKEKSGDSNKSNKIVEEWTDE